MFCPYCGRRFEGSGSRCCPYCGQDLSSTTSASERAKEFFSSLRSRLSPCGDRHKLFLTAGMIAIAIMAGVIVFLEVSPGEQSDPVFERPPPSSLIVVGQDSYIELGDDFSDGSLSAYMTSGGEMVIYLNQSISDRNSEFLWILKNDLSNTYLKTAKESGDVTWTEPEVGRYTVLVYCYGESQSDDVSESYMGTFTYYGDKRISFEWTYGGRPFSTVATVSLSDMVEYSKDSVPTELRTGADPSRISDMIVTDKSVKKLEKSLRSCYDSRYDWDGYRYADFVLSFVQQCILYSSDTANHYMQNYWAFPAETLFSCCGDDEDAAILYASIMECAGYGTSMVLMPDRWYAAVDMDGYTVPDVTVPGDHASAKFSRSGHTYLLADASAGTQGLSLGVVKDCYGYDPVSKTVFYYGVPFRDGFGMYLC